jgi:hypothetical protein
MKRTLCFAFALLLVATGTQAQLKNILNKAKSVVSKDSGSNGLTTTDVVNGLKEALTKGAESSSNKLSALNGFFGNAALKILMPPEAAKVENTLRKAGFGKQVDEAILSMNRAAEDAAKSAAPIFVNAIKGMSINDAWGILKGSDTAATSYLKGKTTASLTEAFRPVIEQSLGKVGATKYWNAMFSTYNKLPLVSKVNPDLSAYVTDKALSGIFMQLATEEQTIRKDPVAQTTALLKKVFGAAK